MMSEYDYHCPHCGHKLNRDEDIHFLVSHGVSECSPLRLSKIPGVYGYKSDHNLKISDGDRVDFFCENCKENLQSKSRPDFVEIQLRVADEINFELLFSPICGDRTTYVVMDGELARYGNHFFSIRSLPKNQE